MLTQRRHYYNYSESYRAKETKEDSESNFDQIIEVEKPRQTSTWDMTPKLEIIL